MIGMIFKFKLDLNYMLHLMLNGRSWLISCFKFRIAVITEKHSFLPPDQSQSVEL